MSFETEDDCDNKDVTKVTDMECGNFNTSEEFHGIQFGKSGHLTLVGKDTHIWACGDELYNKNEDNGLTVCKNICNKKFGTSSCENSSTFNKRFDD